LQTSLSLNPSRATFRLDGAFQEHKKTVFWLLGQKTVFQVHTHFAHFIATGLPSQQNRSDNAFRFKRAAFYMGQKRKVGLVAAKASALRIKHRHY
jgi:hypothetical protein